MHALYLVTCEVQCLCLLPNRQTADNADMSTTNEHIYSKTCDECDRPALTFDRDDRALCPSHSRTIVKARPVKFEIPVPVRSVG